MTEDSVRYRPVRLLPNMVTIFALCSGLSAVKFALEGELTLALAMIGIAAVLDLLDGRLARLLDATSRIGAELDSLSDAISFGVAPALILYTSLLHSNGAGWIIALLFTASMVLRLARFNALLDDDTRPAWEREFFTGVPAPAGALIALLPIAVYEQFGSGWWSNAITVGAWTIFAAALAVSTIPTLALKSVSVPPQAVAVLLILVTLAGAALVTFPLVLMMVLVGIYLAHIPFAIYSERWVSARPETWDYKPAERRAHRKAARKQQPRRLPALRRPVIRRPVIKVSSARLGLRRPK